MALETSNIATVDWDAMYEDEEEAAASASSQDGGESHGSVIKHLISQIKIGMDLTKVVLPTFILERRSLLEMYADFFAHPDLFSSIPDYKTPEQRMIQIVKWYLSAFHAGRQSSVAKKPYNPILGELFICHWNLDEHSSTTNPSTNVNSSPTHQAATTNNGSKETTNSSGANNNNNNNKSPQNEDSNLIKYFETVEKRISQNLPNNNLLFIAEQVSHHPPVSAFYVQNILKKISCNAHIYTKSKFLGFSVGVHNIGEGTINLHSHNETYVCTFPSAYGRSILTVPWMELGGEVSITCKQTGYSARIDFLTKPLYGGKKHLVTGEIYRPEREKFMSIEGEWNDIMYCKSVHSGDKQVFVDTKNMPAIKKNVERIKNQSDKESRNVWKEVTRCLKSRDVKNATFAKSVIEQKQRDELKLRAEKNELWTPKYFCANGDKWIFKVT